MFPGGLAILAELFDALEIAQMRVADGALREGLLYDMVGRLKDEDARVRTVRAMQQRYHVDEDQAQRVEATALSLLRQVAPAWGLTEPDTETLLGWAAQLHEIGLDVSHSQYQKHGAYLLEHADMPGFPREEQRLLAYLVGRHRRKIPPADTAELIPPWDREAEYLMLVLRLAVLLHRGRSSVQLPADQTDRARARSDRRVPARLAQGSSAHRRGPDAGSRILEGRRAAITSVRHHQGIARDAGRHLSRAGVSRTVKNREVFLGAPRDGFTAFLETPARDKCLSASPRCSLTAYPLTDQSGSGVCGEQLLLRRDGWCVGRPRNTLIGSIRAQLPGLSVVREIGLEVAQDAFAVLAPLDREGHLDAPEEIAFHPVGARAVQIVRAVVVEIVDARVFQEPADDRAHLDVVGDARNAGAQGADAAHDEVDAARRLSRLRRVPG